MISEWKILGQLVQFMNSNTSTVCRVHTRINQNKTLLITHMNVIRNQLEVSFDFTNFKNIYIVILYLFMFQLLISRSFFHNFKSSCKNFWRIDKWCKITMEIQGWNWTTWKRRIHRRRWFYFWKWHHFQWRHCRHKWKWYITWRN